MTDEIAGLVPLLFALVVLPAMSIPVVRWAAGHAAALPVVRKMVPVAAIGLPTALIVQVLGGGYTGTAVAAVALICEVVVLLRSAGAANRTARAVTASG